MGSSGSNPCPAAHRQVSQLMGSLNWASGLIPLGCLYLRPLQRHIHSLGLTDPIPPSSIHVSNSGALGVDALSQDWQGRSMYMFPTFPLLNKVIQKLWSTQAAEVILIAPWWPKQSWFPHLLRLCVDHPLFFPYRRDLLSQQDLHTWRLSAVKDFKGPDKHNVVLGLLIKLN